MPPKAKAKAAAGGGGEDDSWENFQKIYSKAIKAVPGCQPMPDLEKIMGKIEEEGDSFRGCWNFAEPVDRMTFQILMHSLREAKYNKIRAIRLWKCDKNGDESVRAVCDYLEMPGGTAVEDLQFTDLNITELGCEFLARTLGWKERKMGEIVKLPPVQLLRLDYNKLGAVGVEKLSMGLAQNNQLRGLHLQYCGIGPEGGQPLSNILQFHETDLDELLLKGNELRDSGIMTLLKGVRRNNKLKQLDIADNKFTECNEILDLLLELFQNNQVLETYILVGNQITDVGAQKLIHGIIGMSHLKEVQVPERCSQSTYEALEIALGKGKKKGKKGKKKK